MRRCVVVLMAMVATVAGLGSPASAATAESVVGSGETQILPQSGAIVVRYKLVNRSKTTNVTNTKQIIARCVHDGGRCTLTQFANSTRTFGAALGISIKAIASDLSISASRSVTIGASASCTSSRKLKRGEVFVAYPMGSRHKYRVKRTVAGSRNPSDNGSVTSGWRYTFNPYQVGIDCRIIKK